MFALITRSKGYRFQLFLQSAQFSFNLLPPLPEIARSPVHAVPSPTNKPAEWHLTRALSHGVLKMQELLRIGHFTEVRALLDHISATQTQDLDSLWNNISSTSPLAEESIAKLAQEVKTPKDVSAALTRVFARRFIERAAAAGDWDSAIDMLRRIQVQSVRSISPSCYLSLVTLLCRRAEAQARQSSNDLLFSGRNAANPSSSTSAIVKSEIDGLSSVVLLSRASALLREMHELGVPRPAALYARLLQSYTATAHFTVQHALNLMEQWAADTMLVGTVRQQPQSRPTATDDFTADADVDVPPVLIYALQTLCLSQHREELADQLQRVWLQPVNASSNDSSLSSSLPPKHMVDPALYLRASDVLQLANLAVRLREPRVLEDVYSRWVDAYQSLSSGKNSLLHSTLSVEQKQEIATLFRHPKSVGAIYDGLILSYARFNPLPSATSLDSDPSSSSSPSPSSAVGNEDSSEYLTELTTSLDVSLHWMRAMESDKLQPSVPTLLQLSERLLCCVSLYQRDPVLSEKLRQQEQKQPSQSGDEHQTSETLDPAVAKLKEFTETARSLTDRVLTAAQSLSFESAFDTASESASTSSESSSSSKSVDRARVWQSSWTEALVGGWLRVGQTHYALNVLDRLLDMFPAPIDETTPAVEYLPLLLSSSSSSGSPESSSVQSAVRQLASVAVQSKKSASPPTLSHQSKLLHQNLIKFVTPETKKQRELEQAELQKQREIEAQKQRQLDLAQAERERLRLFNPLNLLAEKALADAASQKSSQPQPQTIQSSETAAQSNAEQSAPTSRKQEQQQLSQHSSLSQRVRQLLLPLPTINTLRQLVEFASSAGGAHSSQLLFSLLERRLVLDSVQRLIQPSSSSSSSVKSVSAAVSAMQARPKWFVSLADTVAERLLSRGHIDAASVFIARLPPGHDTSRLQVTAAAAVQRSKVAAALQQQLEARQQQAVMLEQMHRQQLLPQERPSSSPKPANHQGSAAKTKQAPTFAVDEEEDSVETDFMEESEAPADVKTAAQRAVAASSQKHQQTSKQQHQQQPKQKPSSHHARAL